MAKAASKFVNFPELVSNCFKRKSNPGYFWEKPDQIRNWALKLFLLHHY